MKEETRLNRIKSGYYKEYHKKRKEKPADLIIKGTKYYFGTVCKKNHIYGNTNPPKSLRYWASGSCVECDKLYALSDRGKQAGIKYRTSEKAKKRFKNYSINRNYGISLEDKIKILNEQNNKCLICKQIMTKEENICIDHNHKTGEVRGLLCRRCNACLGWYEQNKEDVNDYIDRNGGEIK
jgi:hypothetical protein